MAHAPARSDPRTSPLPAASTIPLLALLGLGVVPPIVAQAPTAALSGRVTDRVTERPVEGARVWVVGSDLQTWTDTEGRFSLRRVPAGLRFLRVDFLGTVSRGLRVRLHEGREHAVAFRVDVGVVPLPPLRVAVEGPPVGKLAGFHHRRERGLGVFFTREEIQRRAPLETSDLFRTVPGIRVGPHEAIRRTPTAFTRGPRSCAVEYFLDGVPVPGFHVDDVPPEDIDGIEVYRGPSEVPPAFRRRLTCAAVVIWTRDPGSSRGSG